MPEMMWTIFFPEKNPMYVHGSGALDIIKSVVREDSTASRVVYTEIRWRPAGGTLNGRIGEVVCETDVTNAFIPSLEAVSTAAPAGTVRQRKCLPFCTFCKSGKH